MASSELSQLETPSSCQTTLALEPDMTTPAPSASSADDDHPPSFYCPISCQIMHDPVVLEDGHTYEQRHIAKWLESKNTSPVTGAPLPSKNMFPNHAMRNGISEYFQKIFSVHRRAIRKAASTRPPLRKSQVSFSSNAALLRCVDALMKASVLVNADLSTESILRRIVDEARELLGAEVASVFLVDHSSNELVSTVNSTGAEIRIPNGAGIAGHVATSGDAVVIADAYTDGRFNQAVDKETGFRTKSILCVPIKSKKGTMLGVAQLINKSASGGSVSEGNSSGLTTAATNTAFTSEDERFFSVFASQAAAAIASSGASFEPEPKEGQSPSSSSSSAPSSMPVSLEAGAVAESKDSGVDDADASSSSCRSSTSTGSCSGATNGNSDELSAKPVSGGCAAAFSSSSATTSSGSGGAVLSTTMVLTSCSGGGGGPASPKKKSKTKGKELQEVASSVASNSADTGESPLPPSPSSPPSASSSPLLLLEAEAAELSSMLEGAYRGFDLDVLRLSELTDHAPLSTLGSFLLERSGTSSEFGLDRTKLHNFLREVEKGYSDDNPYHNKAHAASVVHMAHALLLHGGVAQAVGKGRWFKPAPSSPPSSTPTPTLQPPASSSRAGATEGTVGAAAAAGSNAAGSTTSTAATASLQQQQPPQRPVGALETLAVVLAAACHDYEHPGVTNAFLVKSLDERAVKYNDAKPNESHHAAASFALLLDQGKGCDVLSHLAPKEFTALRELFVSLILGTDMGEDKAIVESAKAAVARHTEERLLRVKKAAAASAAIAGSTGSATDTEAAAAAAAASSDHLNLLPPIYGANSNSNDGIDGDNGEPFDPASKSEALAVLRLAFKAADVGHLALPWKSHLVWVVRLEREFFAQGDREKEAGHSPVSFLMDRAQPGVSQSQAGFFKFVVAPMFGALEAAFPLAKPMVEAVELNRSMWAAE